MEITKTSKNFEIAQAFAQQLESGRIFCYATSEIKTSKKTGKCYKTLFIAKGGRVKNDTKTFLSTNQEYRITLDRGILGYVLVEECHNLIKPLLNQGGVVSSDDLKIQKEYSLSKSYDEQQPKKIGDRTCFFNGKPIYEQATIVMSDEKDFIAHDNIDLDNIDFVLVEDENESMEEAVFNKPAFAFN